jgi:uncharacterized protein YecE (DUF72 family)
MHAFIGCAGWSIPKNAVSHFPVDGTHLQRYAAVLPAVEINSSFYRPHRVSTYQRWAASVPADFRFSVKVPKKITHEQRLVLIGGELAAFLAEVAGLGEKLGCLLMQLPPSLKFEANVAETLFAALRRLTSVSVACEPRHATWFEPLAEQLLREHSIARAAADPACVPAAAEPGGADTLAYYRLHGSPRMYYSAYEEDYLAHLAVRMKAVCDRPVWCIFDNTALGAAYENALSMV